LLEAGADIDDGNNDGETALHGLPKAATSACHYLIRKRANVDARIYLDIPLIFCRPWGETTAILLGRSLMKARIKMPMTGKGIPLCIQLGIDRGNIDVDDQRF